MQVKDSTESENRLAQGFDWKTAVAVAITVLTWASAFAGIRVGLQAYSPESVALLVLAAAISSAIYSVGQKPYLRRYGALQFTTYAVWFGTLFLLWFLPGLVQEMSTAVPVATWAIIYMGIFPGAIGYVSWFYVLSRLPASQAGSFLYLIPATAIFIAWLWLGEIPGAAAWIGGALILAGVLLVNIRRSK